MSQSENDGFVQTIASGGELNIPFDFKIADRAEIKIVRKRSGVETTLVLNTDYTIADNQLNVDLGGVAVLIGSAAPAVAADIYTALLVTPYNRGTLDGSSDFNQSGDFFALTLNKQLDFIIRMINRLARDTGKSLKFAETLNQPTATITEIVAPGKVLMAGANAGEFEEGPDASDIAAAQTNATNAAASALAADASADAAAASEANAAAVVAGALQKSGDDMTGVLGLANGTAAAPSLAFADDKNTGIYSRADEEINFSITGTERARIDQYGFSLGGIAPNFNGANGQVLHTHNPTAGGYSGLRITNNESGSGVSDGGFFAAVASEFFAWVYENMPLVFATNSVRRMEIKGDGTITTGNGTTVAAGYTAAGDITLPATGKIRALNTAKAWVNFNGTGTVAIRDSFNVTSITDGGTGIYTVNFTNALSSANISAVFSAQANLVRGNGVTASSAAVVSFNISGTPVDDATICGIVFGQ